MTILDASAMLAFLFRETGHERVAAILSETCMSMVNLAEVITRFTRDGHDGRAVLNHIIESPVELVPFLPEDAAIAAVLAPQVQAFGLSLGDRACLALAMARNFPVYTADRIWQSTDLGLTIELIRP